MGREGTMLTGDRKPAPIRVRPSRDCAQSRGAKMGRTLTRDRTGVEINDRHLTRPIAARRRINAAVWMPAGARPMMPPASRRAGEERRFARRHEPRLGRRQTAASSGAGATRMVAATHRRGHDRPPRNGERLSEGGRIPVRDPTRSSSRMSLTCEEKTSERASPERRA